MDSSLSLTSASLLGRLRADSSDERAWSAFVQQYAPKILQWCRRWNLQQADAEDITQTVLMKLATVMKDFEYDATLSFRGWLFTVSQRTVSDFYRQRENKVLASGGSAAAGQFQSLEARKDLIEQLRESFDLEIVDTAMEIVQGRVSSQRWQAYQLTAIHRHRAGEVAQLLDMKVATVYTAKNKVQTMLQEEVERLQETPASSVLCLATC